MMRIAVDEEQVVSFADLFHEPLHVTRVAREQRAAVAVDADDMRHRGKCLVDNHVDARLAHVEVNLGRLAAGVVLVCLQRQMQKNVFAQPMRVFGERAGARRARQK